MATTTALKLADYVVTEAGFGADLGAEKFFDIKCRKAGLKPEARGDRRHGPGAEDERRRHEGRSRQRECRGGQEGLRQPRPAHREREAVRRAGGGGDQPLRHRHRRRDRRRSRSTWRARASEAILCKHWAKGSEGIADLATQGGRDRREQAPPQFAPLYPDEMPLFEKIETIAKRIYRADEVLADKKIRDQLKAVGGGRATATCRSAWPRPSTASPPIRTGAARRRGHSLPVREVRLSAGAGFVVVICGEIMTMPGLPQVPSAETIRHQRGWPDRRPVLRGVGS